jgi:DNA repair protein RecN (Recombination protein N)
MLIGLAIRDVVLVDSLDLAFGPGLTVLTGETGAGKSIILDALGLATGQRADAGLVRSGAERAVASAAFALAPDHPAWTLLEDKGLAFDRGEDLVLRRMLGADGRSRAFVNDQPAGVGVLREIGEALIEVHGQHETVGLLDQRTHRILLDAYGGLGMATAAARTAWKTWREARAEAERLHEAAGRAAIETEDLTLRLSELGRLDPQPDEEIALAEERALLGAAEKALGDIEQAREGLGGDALSQRLSGAFRALERARERAVQSGAGEDNAVVKRLTAATEAVDRALVETTEAIAAVDSAAEAFDFEPGRLDKAEERLFALRAMARKLNVTVDALPEERARMAASLRLIADSEGMLKEADAKAAAAEADYRRIAETLSQGRRSAGERLTSAVSAELAPLKLEKARFRVAVAALPPDRVGPDGADRVEFEISTNPGAPFGGLGDIASGGELARLALALKAVADAVGLRLKRLAIAGQVLVVTHSPQVAARAGAHWRVSKRDSGGGVRTLVQPLSNAEREEELARMLAGAEITDAARAAARALMNT